MIALVFLIVTFINYAIYNKAAKKLDQNKKAELKALFAARRIYTFGPLIGILILFSVLLFSGVVSLLVAYIICYILAIVYSLISRYYFNKKLKESNFPIEYIKSYMLWYSINSLGGFVIFFTLIFNQLV